MAGVASILRPVLGERWLAGLWELLLQEQLAWRVVDCKKANGEPLEKIKDQVAPLWSWASVDGVIEPGSRLSEPRDYSVKVLDCCLEPDGRGDTIGQPTKGYLHLQGHLGCFCICQDENSAWVIDGSSETLRDAMIELSLDVDPKTDEEKYYALALMYNSDGGVEGYSGKGLLLEKGGTKGRFIRVCSFAFDGLSEKEWNAFKDTYQNDSTLSVAYDPVLGHTIFLD